MVMYWEDARKMWESIVNGDFDIAADSLQEELGDTDPEWLWIKTDDDRRAYQELLDAVQEDIDRADQN